MGRPCWRRISNRRSAVSILREWHRRIALDRSCDLPSARASRLARLPEHWRSGFQPRRHRFQCVAWPQARSEGSRLVGMKRETIAIHAGYDGDPTTKAVAVPIYQTVALEFDSAEHGAALFNLEVEGNIYTRIGNPTNTVLEKRVAALEGGVDGLSVSSGMAAIEYSLINIAETGNNIVSLPQLY